MPKIFKCKVLVGKILTIQHPFVEFIRLFHHQSFVIYGIVSTHYLYMTGYLKTDQNVTLGLLNFIAPANSHTHTLPIHCCINRLSWLACFSRAGFVDHVKSWLRWWGSWRALDRRYGFDTLKPALTTTGPELDMDIVKGLQPNILLQCNCP